MKSVLSKTNGAILQIRLNRPDRKNALGPEIIQELTRLFHSIKTDSPLRAVHLSAAGSDFCAGADLRWMASSGTVPPDEMSRLGEALSRFYEAVTGCPVPLVTQVQGRAFGGGVGLCAVSDIVLAEEGSSFALSEVRRGLIPAVMLPYVIRKMGPSRSRELTFTGRLFSARQALQYGLVHFVIPRDECWEKSRSVLTDLLQGGPAAIRECRALFAELEPMQGGFSRETLIARLSKQRASAEAAEGLAAFFAKRSPAWTHEKCFLESGGESLSVEHS